MGTIRTPLPVLYFTGIIFKDEAVLKSAVEGLTSLFGPVLERTDYCPFLHTDYYEREMGKGLIRCLLLFESLGERERLAEIKLKTNHIEECLAVDGKRPINIDPGYLALENVILATTKGYTHRVYLGSGIYADLTLIFHRGTYRPLDWTYPDYKIEETISTFNRWRGLLKAMIRRSGRR
jgi:hypothetical protein